MKRLKLLFRILRQTGTDRMLLSFLLFVLLCALVILAAEPGIDTLGDALWFCFAAVSTIGFGDVVVTGPVSRVLTVILSVYAVLVIAIVTGAVVSYFQQLLSLRQRESLSAFLDRLEHLPELSREELEALSRQVRQFQSRR